MSTRSVVVFLNFFGYLVSQSSAAVVSAEAPLAPSMTATSPGDDLVAAYIYQPAPSWTIESELGFSLTDRPLETSNSRVTYNVNDLGTITYMLYNKNTTEKGWSDLYLKESIITLIARESGIAANSVEVSESSALPDRPGITKKLAFEVSPTEYETLRASRAEVRYIFRAGIHRDLVRLADFDLSSVVPKGIFNNLKAIMSGLIFKLGELNQLGFSHGQINVANIYINKEVFEKSGGSFDVRLADFSQSDFINNSNLMMDWSSVLDVFKTLIPLVSSTPLSLDTAKILLDVSESTIESISQIVASGGPSADFPKLVSESINGMCEILNGEVVDDARPTKAPRR